MANRIDKLDVICQISSNGEVIPLRIRITDEEGERQTFNIIEYKDISSRGTYETPDGIFVTSEILTFECHIIVFGKKTKIRLYYNKGRSHWTMTA